MIEGKNIRTIVTDIEGTTSSLSFVKDVLFPYARKNIAQYVQENEVSLTEILNDVRSEENNPNLTIDEIIKTFIGWIDEDRKITPLKTIQGMIWKAGYESGELRGHIYNDALLGLKRWKERGIDLYVYSSGSIAAQKLLFENTEQGDLTPLFSGYFDTTIGAKLESESYKKIALDIGCPSAEILFLSDHIGELEAAQKADMEVILLDRENESTSDGFSAVQSFDEIIIQEIAA